MPVERMTNRSRTFSTWFLRVVGNSGAAACTNLTFTQKDRTMMKERIPSSMASFRVASCMALCLLCSSEAFVPATQKSRNHVSIRHKEPLFVAKELKSDLAQKKQRRIKVKTIDPQRTKKKKISDGAEYQRLEMLNHELLTKEQEFDLGSKIKKASKLREDAIEFIEKKRAESINDDEVNLMAAEDSYLSELVEGDDFGHLSIHNMDDSAVSSEIESVPLIDVEYLSTSFLKNNVADGTQQLSDVGPPLDDGLLTDEDIIVGLGLKGGRAELQQTLVDGALARDELIRSNIRLVVSIAKRWAKQSARHTAAEGSRLSLYAGGWDRPSLDEAIQEGILGLARAADKFDPNRGLRFSTYSTWWVTSHVRTCFQRAVTGCLHVPANLHEIKLSHSSILKRCYSANEEIPSEEDIAEEIGVTVKRLRTALRYTQSLLSIDAPVGTSPSFSKGSNAGGLDGNVMLLSDTLQCGEAIPEDWVELSFLRQCLENAMAAELSPHERDVLRLRLGLDDGVTRTVREVVEVCGGSVSIADVRRAEKRAFKKLRSPYAVQTYQLLSYLDFAGVDAREHAIAGR